MRITLLSYTFWPPDFGGELLISIERAESLAKRGHQITFLTSGRPGLPARELKNGITILRSPMVHDGRLGRLVRRLVFFIWSLTYLVCFPYDILHIISPPGLERVSSSFSGMLLTFITHIKRAKCLTVYALMDSETETIAKNGFSSRLFSHYLLGLDCIIGVSPEIYQALAKEFDENANLIICGVREDIFHPLPELERQRIRSEGNTPQDAVIFTFLGSVGRRKGFDVLASAFANLSEKYGNWYLWVIGPFTKTTNQNIVAADVAESIHLVKDNERVIFWGRIDDRSRLAAILGASNVFVFPSRKEGFGIAPMEAMAAGLPVIISRLPGVTDTISIQGETGYYVSPGNVEELQKAMKKLGSDPDLCATMGRKARKRVVEACGWQQHIDQWEALYQSLLWGKCD